MHKDWLELLCCPACKGCLEARLVTATPHGRTKSAVLLCSVCNAVAGVIRNFKVDFLHFDRNQVQARLDSHRGRQDACTTLPWEVVDEALSPGDARLDWQGHWENWSDGSRLSEGKPGDRIIFRGVFVDAGVRLLKHPWSGKVRFFVDGKLAGEADLYAPDDSTVTWFPIVHDLDPGMHTVEIVPAGERNPRSAASQVFFHELWITRPFEGGTSPPRVEINRVLPFFPSVLELMRDVSPDGLILDCGCGDRILADPRYVNLDFQPFQLPMVHADVLNLPFRTGSFDLVLNQALLEHVPDPFAAAREMIRVTKSGGRIWSGMAFMQPVHAVPGHYFNATVWGLEQLFSSMEILDTSWFGELSHTIDWLLKASGVASRLSAERFDALMNQIKPLDSLVSYESLRSVASGVSVLARKPY